jgi:hypothetical protein
MSAAAALASWILAAQAPLASVALDLHALSWSDYRRLDGLQLERKVSMRLVEDGFAVVSAESGAADIIVRFSMRSSNALHLEASHAESLLQRDAQLDGRLAARQLEIAQKVSELARTLAAQIPVATQTPVLVSPPVVEPMPEPAALWDIGVTLGALARPPAVDPLVLLAARLGSNAVRARVEAGITDSNTPQLSVLEVQAAGGVAYRFRVTRTLNVEPALEAGIVLQSYSVPLPAVQAQKGTLTLPAVWAPVTLEWSLFQRLTLTARIAVGGSRPVTHVYEGDTVWARSALRLEASAGANWAF